MRGEGPAAIENAVEEEEERDKQRGSRVGQVGRAGGGRGGGGQGQHRHPAGKFQGGRGRSQLNKNSRAEEDERYHTFSRGPPHDFTPLVLHQLAAPQQARKHRLGQVLQERKLP